MRRALDFYPTPAGATNALLSHVPIHGSIVECCVGDGAISKVLGARPGTTVITNDLDRKHRATSHADARDYFWWRSDVRRVDWVVTNPPFVAAMPILKQAYSHSRVGVAFLLRLSFLEPCDDRGPWLAEHPPSRLLVLPRISFTGDGKTDSVTCAWFVWEHTRSDQQIAIVRFDPNQGQPLLDRMESTVIALKAQQ